MIENFDKTDPVHVIVFHDEDENEALYVGGDFVHDEGTVYTCDIAAALEKIGNPPVHFSRVLLDLPEDFNAWPAKADSLTQYIAKEPSA